MIHFLFPKDLLTPREPDRVFADQFHTLAEVGISVSLFSSDSLSERSLRLSIPANSKVVYRGWMLKPREYAALEATITQSGGQPFTTVQQYLNAHYLPNWYPHISDLTPETRIYPANAPIEAELRMLNWGAYFIKDYVKSLKTARGAIVRDPVEAPALLAEMAEYRGEIEGGICVRRVEEFALNSEQRYFVINGKAYSADENAGIPMLVETCAEKVPSNFFSVDIARRSDGVLRVVEIGDGQVSDIVGWTANSFARMWASVS